MTLMRQKAEITITFLDTLFKNDECNKEIKATGTIRTIEGDALHFRVWMNNLFYSIPHNRIKKVELHADIKVEEPSINPADPAKEGSSIAGIGQRPDYPTINKDDLNRGLSQSSFEFIGYFFNETGERFPIAVFKRDLPEMGIMIDTRAQLPIGIPTKIEDLMYYEIQIEVASAYQRTHNLVVIDCDDVYSVKEFCAKTQADMGEIRKIQAQTGKMIIRIDNIVNSETHAVVRILHNLSADLIAAGANLIYVIKTVQAYVYLSDEKNDQRILPLQLLQQDPRWEELKPIIRKYFPNIDLDSQRSLPREIAGLLQVPDK